ncbi:MAG: cell envelope integrity protein TolA [Desulfobacteraceae bacterium]|nr:cell envelope integrity protein TolA [Desulfobacteraceae bacterium]
MEPLSLGPRRLPRSDLLTGLGGSFLVHVLIGCTAFVGAWILPHQPLKPPYCSVNLVSLKDIGMGQNEPKGNPKAPESAAPAEAPKSVGKASDKSGPAVPVKRLRLDESAKREDTPAIKKIEPKEAPKFTETPQNLSAIEKNLDKLIAKPKVVPKTSAAIEQEHSPKPAAASQEPGGGRPGKAVSGKENVQRGTPTGSADAGSRGTAQGSTVGSPDGSSAASALANMYGERVREAIQREWRLIDDQGVGGLKAVVEVQIRKTGEIINIQVVKTSGNSVFDQSAVRAVQRASLPAVPEVLVQASTRLILTFIPGRVS